MNTGFDRNDGDIYEDIIYNIQDVMAKNRFDDSSYSDIIDLPHHVSSTHPQMSRINRAAQFASFAALKGYDDVIREVDMMSVTEASDNKYR